MPSWFICRQASTIDCRFARSIVVLDIGFSLAMRGFGRKGSVPS
jgi:hypothetical protein